MRLQGIGQLFVGIAPALTFWETADANANLLMVDLPAGGATNVPVMAIGTGIIRSDLGFFDGLTQPELTVLDADKDSYIGFSHSADDVGSIYTLTAAGSRTESISFTETQTKFGGVTSVVPLSDDLAALGTTALQWSDLFLASGAVLNFNNGNVTVTHAAGTLTVAGLTLLDIGAGILELNNAVRFDTGVATVAAAYSVGRNADGTNLMQLNVPTGASFELSVNDVAIAALSATALTFPAAINIQGTSSLVINDSGADVDLRIEAVGNPNFVVIDAAANVMAFGAAVDGGNFLILQPTALTWSSTYSSGQVLRVLAATHTDGVTAVSGTAAVFRGIALFRQTLAATNANVVTTHATSVWIQNAPAAGTNQSFTTSSALHIDDGDLRLDGALVGDLAQSAAGDLVFKTSNVADNSGTTRLTIGSNAATAVTTLSATSVVVGSSGAGNDVTYYGATAGCTSLWDASEDQLVLTQTNGATTGVERTLDVSQTHTGIGASAEAVRSVITSNVALGTYANALFGKIDLSTSGEVTGLIGAVCAEVTMPSTDAPSGGEYAAFEAEFNMAGASVGGRPMIVMDINVWGGNEGQFDDNGLLFDIAGVTSGATDFFYTNAVAFNNCDAFLKIRVAGTVYYIPLSDNQAGT